MSILIKLRDFNSFSPAESQARDYILRNPREVVSETIYDCAGASFTSPATVSRLCRRLGLPSYRALKLALAEEVGHFEKIDLDLLDTTTVEREDPPSSVIDKVTSISMRAIEETRTLVDESLLRKVVATIRKAEILDFYGIGASYLVAMDAHMKFIRVGKCAVLCQQYDRQRVQAINSDSTHAGIVCSYSGETEEMRRIVESLRSNGTPIVSITKSSPNSVSRAADYSLLVTARETLERSGAMASRTAMLYVVDLLYTLYITSDYDHLMDRVRKTLIG